jgi:4-diphosphocytidyl-2-C-methyl-D-erythritol kinase
MVVFPNCKINIGLQVTGKRADGFHDLQTVFYPVAIKDALEIVPADKATYSSSGLPVDTADQDNLCLRAFHLLKQDIPSLPPVKIHLHKSIPVGAGLGGGSSDAAFCLRLLNDKFNLQLSAAQLADYALQLGSDCPFFIRNVPSFATGRGEQLEAVPLDLTTYSLLIVNPRIHISTAWAFAQLRNIPATPDLKNAITLPIEHWKENIYNDFETAVFNAHPVIGHIKEQMYKANALYASMSGTGSSVFGIFPNEHDREEINFPANYFSRWL